MSRGAVEKGWGFPQLCDAFPLLFPEISRLRAESVVLGSGAFRDLTEVPA